METKEMKKIAYQSIIDDWKKDIEKATNTIAQLEHEYYGNITHFMYRDGMAMAKRTIEIATGEIEKYEEKLKNL